MNLEDNLDYVGSLEVNLVEIFLMYLSNIFYLESNLLLHPRI